MKALILLFAALIVLVTICETRPLAFVAIQNKTAVKSDSDEIGNVVGYLTIRKGAENLRLRVFGIHSVDSNIRDAWLSDEDGKKFASLRIGNDSSAFDGRYIFGDFFLNSTVSTALLSHKLKVVISTSSDKEGVIGGYLMSKPFLGFSLMDGDQVVPPVSTSKVGFAVTVIEPAVSNGSNIVDNILLIANNSTLGVSVVQNSGTAKKAGLYGEAGPGINGMLLHSLGHRSSRYAYQFRMQTVPEDFGLVDGLTYVQITTAAKPNGSIRGDLEPLLKRTRALDVNTFEIIGGTTSVQPSSLSILKKAHNIGSANPTSGTVLGCQTNSTFHYAANFFFQAPVSRRNSNLLRGITLTASLKQSTSATWEFALYDTATGNQQKFGSFSGSAGVFEEGLAHYVLSDISAFITNNKNIVLRVSTSATEPSELLIDQLQLRAHVANGVVSDTIKAIIDNGSILSYKN